MTENLHVIIYFGGGAEILFEGVKEEKLSLVVDNEKWTVGRLITWIRDNRLKGRQELFVKGDTVNGFIGYYYASSIQLFNAYNMHCLCQNVKRPGILVLINDTDWDLLGQDEYLLQDNDQIHFISTLHGG